MPPNVGKVVVLQQNPQTIQKKAVTNMPNKTL
jgi:hypothetical protein